MHIREKIRHTQHLVFIMSRDSIFSSPNQCSEILNHMLEVTGPTPKHCPKGLQPHLFWSKVPFSLLLATQAGCWGVVSSKAP